MVAGIGGMWAPAALRLARKAASKASKLVQNKVASAIRPINTALEPAFAKAPQSTRQAVHPAALLREQKSRRWHSTSAYQNIDAAIRRFMSTGHISSSNVRVDRARFLKTKTGRAVFQFTGRAPFASTLRPNLTGGVLPRTAGGYGFGSGTMGGARYFSHTPASQAQVVQNVSAAVRAFWISGQKAQFDGFNTRGEKCYRAVSALQDEASKKMTAVPFTTPGSYIDFRLNPTVTALSPLGAAFATAIGTQVSVVDASTLNTEGFLDVLSVDFARSLKDLAATLTDVKKLAMLGDLPIHLEKGCVLRVRFPGVDAETVERLCDDLGLTRGTVGEDADFDSSTGVEMALKFPFAPGADSDKSPTLTSPGGSLRSRRSSSGQELFEKFGEIGENPWLIPPELESYESGSSLVSSGEHCSEDFEGFEGVYRFLDECDRARGRF